MHAKGEHRSTLTTVVCLWASHSVILGQILGFFDNIM